MLLALHTLRVVLTGAFLHPKRMNWVVGCSLLFLAVFAAYTGYLLPMDQLAYWATADRHGAPARAAAAATRFARSSCPTTWAGRSRCCASTRCTW